MPSNWDVRVVGGRPIDGALGQIALAVNPRGGLRDAREAALLFLRDYAASITHVESGTLQEAHDIDVDESVVFLNPTFIKPNGYRKQRPYLYGPYEHVRGGTHAFYKRTVDEAGDEAVAAMMEALESRMPGGLGRLGGLVQSIGGAAIKIGITYALFRKLT